MFFSVLEQKEEAPVMWYGGNKTQLSQVYNRSMKGWDEMEGVEEQREREERGRGNKEGERRERERE